MIRRHLGRFACQRTADWRGGYHDRWYCPGPRSGSCLAQREPFWPCDRACRVRLGNVIAHNTAGAHAVSSLPAYTAHCVHSQQSPGTTPAALLRTAVQVWISGTADLPDPQAMVRTCVHLWLRCGHNYIGECGHVQHCVELFLDVIHGQEVGRVPVERAQARTTLGREFPMSALSMAERGPRPAIARVSCAPSQIPYGGFSPVRL